MRWIFVLVMNVAVIVTLFLPGVFSTETPITLREESQPNQLPKISDSDIKSTKFTDNENVLEQQKSEPFVAEDEEYDWRLDFWTQEQLDAFEKSYRSPILTDQEKPMLLPITL